MSRTLRLATLLAAAGLGAAAPAMSLTPGRLAGFTDLFTPRPRGPDYELHMASYRGEALHTRLKIRRHRDWVRVERSDAEGVRLQRIHTPTGVIVETADTPATGIASMSIRAPDRTPSPGFDYASRKTGKIWKAAGQRCDIWEVYRAVDQGYTTVTRMGCVTRDGIEVARWSNGRTGNLLGDRITGYYLRRGKMDEADIRPPTPALDLSAWLAARPAAAGNPDGYEVVLKDESARRTVTIRHQAGASYTETANPDGSRDMFGDRGDGVTVSARVGATGAPESYTARRGPAPRTLPDARLPLPPQTVLGQTCAWFDAMPDVADAGQTECRTADGVVLVVRKSGPDGEVTLTAVTLSRRPLAAAELTPPAWLLDLRRWGVPD